MTASRRPRSNSSWARDTEKGDQRRAQRRERGARRPAARHAGTRRPAHRHHRRRPDHLGGPVADMTPEQISWFVDNTVSRPCWPSRAWARSTAPAGSPRNLGRARSRPARLLWPDRRASVSQALAGVNSDQPGGRVDRGRRGTLDPHPGRRQDHRAAARDPDPRQRRPFGPPRRSRHGRATTGPNLAGWPGYNGRKRSPSTSCARARPARSRSPNGSREGGRQDRRRASRTDHRTGHRQRRTDRGKLRRLAGGPAAGRRAGRAVVFIFLRDWRATFITATAMPMSLIPAFAILDRSTSR
jgi:hypothetical protein